MKEHTLIVLLQDRAGVLHRTVSLLRRRQFNIASLSVGHSEMPGISRMTLVVDTADVTQVVKQLDRLVDVLVVRDVTEAPSVQRETALAKVAVEEEALFGLITMVRDAGARVLDVAGGSMVVEITDSPARVDAFVEELRAMGLRELMRTGRLAMMRGQADLSRPQAFREQGDGVGEEDAA